MGDIVEYHGCEVITLVGDAQRFSFLRSQMLRQTRAAYLRGIGARRMQNRSAGAVYSPRVVSIQQTDVIGIECLALPEMREPFPAAADSQHLIIHVRGLIDDALNDCIQPRNVSSAC